MNELTTTIYRNTKDLPALDDSNFFHSSRLFEISRQASRQKPYMVVVTDGEGRLVSHMLGIVRYRTFLFPPFLLIHCRVLGEGVFTDTATKLEEQINTLRVEAKAAVDVAAKRDKKSIQAQYDEQISSLEETLTG